MDISVIICTYNRCASLRRTLQTCCELEIPAGVQWELLVVDNNSTDATKQVCEEFHGKLPLRYLFESRQGKSNALNRSIDEARGALLLYTDDDVDVDAKWLVAHLDAARRYPQDGFFGGKIIPRWETEPPRWMVQHARTLLTAVTVSYDLGDEEQPLPPGMAFFGANLIFRKSVFKEEFRFRTDIGPQRGNEIRGEDSDLIFRLLASGHRAHYIPSAQVYHRNPSDRARERYVWAWFGGYGMKEARLDRKPSAVCWGGVPRHLWRKLFVNGSRYLITRYVCASNTWLPSAIQTARAWGSICEYRRIAETGNLGNHRE